MGTVWALSGNGSLAHVPQNRKRMVQAVWCEVSEVSPQFLVSWVQEKDLFVGRGGGNGVRTCAYACASAVHLLCSGRELCGIAHVLDRVGVKLPHTIWDISFFFSWGTFRCFRKPSINCKVKVPFQLIRIWSCQSELRTHQIHKSQKTLASSKADSAITTRSKSTFRRILAKRLFKIDFSENPVEKSVFEMTFRQDSPKNNVWKDFRQISPKMLFWTIKIDFSENPGEKSV